MDDKKKTRIMRRIFFRGKNDLGFEFTLLFGIMKSYKDLKMGRMECKDTDDGS